MGQIFVAFSEYLNFNDLSSLNFLMLDTAVYRWRPRFFVQKWVKRRA